MGDTRIFNSIPMPILWRLVSVDTDTYFDTKIYSQIVLSIPEMITYFVGIDHFRYPSLFQKYFLKVYIIKHQSQKYQHVKLVKLFYMLFRKRSILTSDGK